MLFSQHSYARSKAILAGIVAFLVGFFPYFASAAVPNDPEYHNQWHHGAVGLEQAWDFAKGSPTVTVAVLDSGVDLSHPDLADRIWKNENEIPGDGIDNDGNGFVDDMQGWDFVDGDNDANPVLRGEGFAEGEHHGTLVAGVIGAAGNNGEGVAGASWNVRIMPLRVLDSAGFGSTLSVRDAIEYATANGAQIINISFSGPNYSQLLADALWEAHQAGVVVVAAAGNEGDTEQGGNMNQFPSYPACYRGPNNEAIVIAVASVDRQDHVSSFSNYGSNCISLSAPGESFYTTQIYRPVLENYQTPYGDGWFGSSMSAPLVSGVAALLVSMLPDATPAQIRSLLVDHAQNIDHLNFLFIGQIGSGRLDAAASLLAAQQVLLSGGFSEEGNGENGLEKGSLIKRPDNSAVYYFANDGKRYVFPNEKVYSTWYGGFADVQTIPAEELAKIPLGGNVTYRPGVRMVKIQSDPRVFAVAKGGVLRHVETEAVAEALYGPNWGTHIDDISEAFFLNYSVGAPVQAAFQYSPLQEVQRAENINQDKTLTPA